MSTAIAEPKKKTTKTQTPPPVDPPADPLKEEVKDQTPEELEAGKKRFNFAMGFGPDPDATVAEPPKEEATEEATPPPEETTETTETKPVADDKPKTETEPEPEDTEEPSAGAAALLTPPVDDEAIERAAQRGAQKALEATQQAPEKKPDPTFAETIKTLPRAYQNDLRTIQKMEAQNPAFAGLTTKLLDWYRREDEYVRKWQSENAGKKFQAAEHDEFYAQMPPIDEEAFATAKEALDEDRIQAVKEEAKAEARAESRKETAQLRYEHEFQKAVPAIAAQAANTIVGMIEQVDPELGKVLEQDGQKRITAETLTALEEQDPVAFEVLTEEGEKLKIVTTELSRLTRFGEHYQENPNLVVNLQSTGEKFRPHAELTAFATALEDELAGKPKAQTKRDGKTFMRSGELFERQGKIIQAKDLTAEQKKAAITDLNARVWVIGENELRTALQGDYAARAKQKITKMNILLEKKGKGKTTPASVTTPKAPEPKPTEAPAPTIKPKPPTTVSSSDRMNTQQNNKNSGQITTETVQKAMWG